MRGVTTLVVLAATVVGGSPAGHVPVDTPAPAVPVDRVEHTDLAFGGVTVRRRPSTGRLLAALNGRPTIPGLTTHVRPSCTGTQDGHRVQVLYAVEADDADRFDAVRPVLEEAVRVVDDTVAASAAKTGGGRRVRWVMDAACTPALTKVVLPAGALGTDTAGFRTMVGELARLGHADPARKYLVFADATAVCGVSDLLDDDRPVDNLHDNGSAPMYARIDSVCWTTGRGLPSMPAHELMHLLGGVQRSAPHATTAGHCTQNFEVMCYSDGGPVRMRQVCRWSASPLLDCGNDDYFHTSPRPGSYLARQWNVARSSYLDVVPRLRGYRPPTVIAK